MITVRNNAALSSPVAIASVGSAVPFDTVVINTNNNASLDLNAIKIANVGVYGTHCAVTVSNAGSSDVTVTLALNAQGNPVSGASVAATVPASGTTDLIIDYPQRVISSESGTASLTWMLSGGSVNLTNAIATVFKYT